MDRRIIQASNNAENIACFGFPIRQNNSIHTALNFVSFLIEVFAKLFYNDLRATKSMP